MYVNNIFFFYLFIHFYYFLFIIDFVFKEIQFNVKTNLFIYL